MSNKERRKAPVLRFKGFTDDWEQRKFSDIAQRISTNININLPNVTYDDIDSENETLNKGIKNLSSGKKGILFQKNDILFGKLRPYLNNIIKVDFKGIAVGDFWVLRAYEDSSFLFSLINTPQYKYIANISSGSKMPRSDWNLVSKYLFCIPSEKEQSHIGNLILKLSQQITLQQRKMNKFQSIKMAILSRIFADKGKTTLFFNDSNATWKEIKLGNIATIIRGASPRPIADSKWFDEKSKVGWLRISDVTSQHGRIKYLEQHLSQLGEKKTRVLKTPHLLLSIAASVGYPVINYVPTGVHDGFLIFKNPQFQLNYGFYWLQSYRNRWQKYGQPGSQVNLNSSIVENTIIDLPSEAEQKKIVSLLFKVDHLILTQKDKISSLKQVKNFLLQNLFI